MAGANERAEEIYSGKIRLAGVCGHCGFTRMHRILNIFVAIVFCFTSLLKDGNSLAGTKNHVNLFTPKRLNNFDETRREVHYNFSRPGGHKDFPSAENLTVEHVLVKPVIVVTPSEDVKGTLSLFYLQNGLRAVQSYEKLVWLREFLNRPGLKGLIFHPHLTYNVQFSQTPISSLNLQDNMLIANLTSGNCFKRIPFMFFAPEEEFEKMHFDNIVKIGDFKVFNDVMEMQAILEKPTNFVRMTPAQNVGRFDSSTQRARERAILYQKENRGGIIGGVWAANIPEIDTAAIFQKSNSYLVEGREENGNSTENEGVFAHLIVGGAKIIKSVAGGFVRTSTGIVKTGANIIGNVTSTVVKTGTGIVRTGSQIFGNVTTNVVKTGTGIVRTGTEIVGNVTSAVLRTGTGVVTRGTEVVENVGVGIVNTSSNFVKSGAQVAENVGLRIVDTGTNIAVRGAEIVRAGTGVVVDVGSGIVKTGAEIVGTVSGDLVEKGSQIVEDVSKVVRTNVNETAEHVRHDLTHYHLKLDSEEVERSVNASSRSMNSNAKSSEYQSPISEPSQSRHAHKHPLTRLTLHV